jgi:putative DNA primase/helicase
MPLPAAFPQPVARFENAWSPEPTDVPPLGLILAEIRDGAYADTIATLRAQRARGALKTYEETKRRLPAFTMSAACLTRAKTVPLDAKIIAHTGILQGDFDAKENPQLEDFATIRAQLAADPHIAFLFRSPGGDGLKAGIRIDAHRHRESFFAAEAHYLHRYGLQIDRSTKDPLRLCFVSHDPHLHLHPGAAPIPVEDTAPHPSQTTWHPPLETTEADVAEMLAHIPPRPAYEDWIRIASAVWSVLPMEIGCRLLTRWSPEEKHGEYAEKHRHRLTHIGIGTLVHYARQHGFDARSAARRRQWAGRLRFAEPTTRDAPADDTLPQDPAHTPPAELDRAFVAQCFHNAQRGDAALYARLVAGHKLYDHLAQIWRTYHTGIWLRDDMRQTLIDSADALTHAYETLARSLDADIRATPAPDGKKDPRESQIRALHRRCEKLRTTGYLGGVLKFAESLLAAKATDFDRHRALLATRNGTIDFAQGLFREHRPADHLTTATPCDFNPDASCPRWERFLTFFLSGDADLIAYLARAVGYSLTGYVDHDTVFFCYGRGANGKSTFTAALKLLLGDLMTTIPIEALLSKAADHNFDYSKAQMEGRRVVVSDEIPESRRLNEAAIKSLVGGDEIAARRPYEKPYTFTPTHKLWLVGNHKPRIEGTDHGIWRRVHLIPWLVTMPEDQRRPRHEILSEFREELSGILNWAIRGYIDYIDRGGLHPPRIVQDATKEYQNDSDQIAQFLNARTERTWGFSTPLTELRQTYEAWCQDEGEEPRYRTNHKLAAYLKEAGWEIVSGHARQKHVLGLHLLPAT